MCKSVEDAAILLSIIAGYDKDPATVNTSVPDYARTVRTPVSKLRVGVPKLGFFENLHPETAKAIRYPAGSQPTASLSDFRSAARRLLNRP